MFFTFQSHPELCKRKYKDFNRWHSNWASQNVTEGQQTAHSEWMLGRTEGLVSNKTHRLTISEPNKTPYRTYTKFKAEVS